MHRGVRVPANTFSPPVRTMAPMSVSLSRESKWELSSAMRGLESALRALGRLRWMRATRGRGGEGGMRGEAEEHCRDEGMVFRWTRFYLKEDRTGRRSFSHKTADLNGEGGRRSILWLL